MGSGLVGEIEHRKGLVLGLTMAETLLLLVFLLLLALTALVRDRDQQITTLSTEKSAVVRELDTMRVELAPVLEKLRVDGIVDAEAIAELTARLQRVAELEQSARNAEAKIAGLQSELVSVSAMADKLKGVEDAMKKAAAISPDDPPATVMQKALDVLEKLAPGLAPGELEHQADILQSVLETARTIAPNDPPADVVKRGLDALAQGGDPLNAAEKRAEEAEARAADFKRQTAEMQTAQDHIRRERDNLMKNGAGTTYPSCWTTPEGGNEYIFSVTINDTGLFVQDAAPAGRRNDPALSLVDPFPRGNEITDASFQKAMTRLSRWGSENKCKFFVNLSDGTAEANKTAYKKRRGLVENHFYIRLR